METNLNPEISAELKAKGQALLDAAYEFWKVHRRCGGPRAVVWLQATCGHFVLFTRGEYREQIMRNIAPLAEETPLCDPFLAPERERRERFRFPDFTL